MKKTLLTLAVLLCSLAGMAQRPSVSILGDSYSTFEGYLTPDTMDIWYFAGPQDARRTDVTKVGETWWMQLIKKRDWKLEVNNSWSGSTICYTGYRDEDYSNRSFVLRTAALGSPDIILIFGGTNDSWAGSPIGEYKFEGWTKEDLFSFRPAMARMLSMMVDYYPNVEIYFILNDGLKEEINESVRTVCKHYQVPCIELVGIDKQNGHPSVKGMKQIREQIEAFLANR